MQDSKGMMAEPIGMCIENRKNKYRLQFEQHICSPLYQITITALKWRNQRKQHQMFKTIKTNPNTKKWY